VVADVLFDRTSLGINVPIATAAVLATVTSLGSRRGPADRLDLWLPAVALAASLGPALRTDPTVVALDIGLVAVGTAAWSIAVSGVPVTRRTATAVTLLGIRAGVVTAVALAWLVTRAGADGFFSRWSGQLGRLGPVLRGAVIAIPILAGFSLLLSSADAVFGRALDDVLHLPVDLDDAAQRAVFSIVAAGLIAGPIALATGGHGILAWARVEPDASPAAGEAGAAAAAAGELQPPRPSRAGATEALVVLFAVDVLFAAFAVVQVLYLFGGIDTLSVVGMTYSDYARQGYFQLVGVVALAGLLLLGAHEVVGRTRPFLVGALALLALTAVILASATLRLALYQGAYGWTELRFFVAASIAWLAACVALSVAMLLVDRMRWLPHALAASAVAVTLTVSALGPQAFVMRENLARIIDPSLVAPGGYAGFDVDYVLTLGDDAIPDLMASLAVLRPAERSFVIARLGRRRDELAAEAASASPLSWSWARERARAALADLPLR
jgi:hypothetical protein